MEKMIICVNCGAKFEQSLVRCPHCGTGYAPAEENEYMDSLDDIRTELQSHKDDGQKRLKKGLSKTILIITVIFALIVAMIVGGMLISSKLDNDRRQQQKEEFRSNQGITSSQENSEK